MAGASIVHSGQRDEQPERAGEDDARRRIHKRDRGEHRRDGNARFESRSNHAGLLVKSLPLNALRWMVIIVVAYAAAMMVRSAMNKPVLANVPS